MKKAYLLSVGINEYDNFQTLGLCVDDSNNISESFKQRFDKLCISIFNDENCTPTYETIAEQLKKIEFLDYAENDIALFFFAGHGFSIDGKDYIAAKNTDLNNLNSAVCTDNIIDSLKKSGAGNSILVIDACRSEFDRRINNFGERTAELSRRRGVVTFFSCSPGEAAKELKVLKGGVFTRTFSDLLKDIDAPFTPFIFSRKLIDGVGKICGQHKLGKQTPYTAVAPLEKAVYDPFSGKRHDVNDQKKELILILGPSNAGKTTIGQFLAREYGYIHAEMSSYAWKRFNEADGYRGSILDFMEHEVWTNGMEDAIAQDLINSNIGEGKLVVCGARRMEEIETILAQGWDVKPIYVFANASERYTRIQYSSGRYGPSYEEFIRKDLKEFSWGIAHMAQMKSIELVINENEIDKCFDRVASIVCE
jgi:adenylate kinase family enzyme